MLPANVDQSVVVSKESLESDDPYDVILSNISFVNALLGEYFTHEELARDALRSYYVDYYLAQVENGGFSQFVYNSGWEEFVIECVEEGLEAMGAVKHRKLFRQCASILDDIGPEGMARFYKSEYFGENEERDVLSEFDDTFFELLEEEDLVLLNSAWLRSLPNLVVMSREEMAAEVERRAAALTDREERAAAALANEPRFMKLIRALCEAAGHELDRVTAGDPSFEYEGEQTTAWHFLTDAGHFHMAEFNGKALMFRGHTDEIVCEIEVPDDLLDLE